MGLDGGYLSRRGIVGKWGKDKYTTPNKLCARLRDLIELCEHWITLVRDKEGTSEKRELMECFDDCICGVVSEML